MLNLNNPVARGTAILSDQKGQTIHGVPLQDDCYRVSVDEVVKGAAFLPYEAGDMRTVEDALGSFVAWPKNLIKIIDHQVRFLLCIPFWLCAFIILLYNFV
jgi:hypothetical protein